MTDGRAREVLQEQIDRYGQEYDAEGIEALRMAIKALEQQPKTGRWIDVETLDSALWHVCSECGETEFYATDYCPNCGAKMEV